jgi:hypothetical protein
LVNIGRFETLGAIARKISIAEVICHDNDDVRFLWLCKCDTEATDDS